LDSRQYIYLKTPIQTLFRFLLYSNTVFMPGG